VTADALPDADWLGFCRRAARAAREAVARYSTTAARGVETGRGEGGDVALVIDRAAEDAVFAQLDALGVGLVAVSEERGELALHGGGETRVVIDPVDGSLNAKRGLPFACVSIAVASGDAMDDVEVGYVAEFDPPLDWWGIRGEGAFRDGRRLPRLEPGRSSSSESRPRIRGCCRAPPRRSRPSRRSGCARSARSPRRSAWSPRGGSTRC
jgi:myo-inositol-1(or 4)-monophosphatase